MGRHICSWIRRTNIVKISILLRLISMFKAILITCQAKYFAGTDKIILKFIGKVKSTIIANNFERGE